MGWEGKEGGKLKWDHFLAIKGGFSCAPPPPPPPLPSKQIEGTGPINSSPRRKDRRSF